MANGVRCDQVRRGGDGADDLADDLGSGALGKASGSGGCRRIGGCSGAVIATGVHGSAE